MQATECVGLRLLFASGILQKESAIFPKTVGVLLTSKVFFSRGPKLGMHTFPSPPTVSSSASITVPAPFSTNPKELKEECTIIVQPSFTPRFGPLEKNTFDVRS